MSDEIAEKQAGEKRTHTQMKLGSPSESDSSDDADVSSDDEEIARIGRQREETRQEQRRNKRSREQEDGSADFSKAMNALLDTHLKAHDRDDPMLARSKGQAKSLESEKLEIKAKKLLAAKRRVKMEAGRRTEAIPAGEKNSENAKEAILKERKLRKVAQRGVIKLFNAISMTQSQTVVADNVMKAGKLRAAERQEKVSEVSKEKFLDMVRAAGK